MVSSCLINSKPFHLSDFSWNGIFGLGSLDRNRIIWKEIFFYVVWNWILYSLEYGMEHNCARTTASFVLLFSFDLMARSSLLQRRRYRVCVVS